jgi:hypothetical protein
MNCSSNSIQIQELIVSGNNNVIDGRQVQTLSLSTDCAQNAQNIADLQQKVAQEISNTAKAQSAAVLNILSSSNSDLNTSIINDVRQNITQQTISNIINTAKTEQRAIISGDNNIVKFDQNQTANLVYKAAQNVINNLKSVQDINNAVVASSDSKASSGDMMMWIIIIVVVAALIFLGPTILKWISGKKDNQDPSAFRMYMGPPGGPPDGLPYDQNMNQPMLSPPMDQMPMDQMPMQPMNQMPMQQPMQQVY